MQSSILARKGSEKQHSSDGSAVFDPEQILEFSEFTQQIQMAMQAIPEPLRSISGSHELMKGDYFDVVVELSFI